MAHLPQGVGQQRNSEAAIRPPEGGNTSRSRRRKPETGQLGMGGQEHRPVLAERRDFNR